jgi:drug/metabolite transporter (DMT)-like permease
MGLSNLSVEYLNYPTQVVFKSAKPVPALFFGVLYHHKRYSPSDFIAVLLMAIGMAAFCMADAAAYEDFSLYGIMLVIAAMLADATSGAVQERWAAGLLALQWIACFVFMFTHGMSVNKYMYVCTHTYLTKNTLFPAGYM